MTLDFEIFPDAIEASHAVPLGSYVQDQSLHVTSSNCIKVDHTLAQPNRASCRAQSSEPDAERNQIELRSNSNAAFGKR